MLAVFQALATLTYGIGFALILFRIIRNRQRHIPMKKIDVYATIMLTLSVLFQAAVWFSIQPQSLAPSVAFFVALPNSAYFGELFILIGSFTVIYAQKQKPLEKNTLLRFIKPLDSSYKMFFGRMLVYFAFGVGMIWSGVILDSGIYYPALNQQFNFFLFYNAPIALKVGRILLTLIGSFLVAHSCLYVAGEINRLFVRLYQRL